MIISLLLILGRIFSFQVITNEIGTTEDFRQLSFEERKCRLPHESEGLLMFKSYSKSACEFECATGTAAKTCLCKPWNFPRYPGEKTPYCDMYGNDCFYWVMIITKTFEDCKCDDDCQSTNFNVFQSSSPFDLNVG